jgi:uncharacterized membrane protein YbhN (UPF0104 family)
VTILVLLMRNLDVHLVWSTLKRINGEMFGLCILQLMLIPLLGALRWKIVLSCFGYRSKLHSLGRIFWIGMAFNQVLPTAVGGDAVRGWMIYKNGVALGDATVSIVAERVILLASLLGIVAIEGWLGASMVPRSLLAFATLGLLFMVVALALLPFGTRLFVLLPDRPFFRLCHDTCDALGKVVMDFRIVALLVLCVLTNLNLVVAGWWLGLALDMPFGPKLYLAVIPIATLAAVIPISMGGWGIREAVMIGLLGPLTGSDTALLYSIALGIAIMLSSLPGFFMMVARPQLGGIPGSARTNPGEDH